MNKKFVAAGMAAAMAATMLPSMAFADEKPTVTLLVPEYNAGTVSYTHLTLPTTSRV